MSANREDAAVPAGQALYDNIILWLIVGIVVPTVVYTVWGLIEILNVPKLPIAP